MNERVLEEDYPVFAGYLYVADGKVIRSDIQGTVGQLKKILQATTITNCDIVGRDIMELAI